MRKVTPILCFWYVFVVNAQEVFEVGQTIDSIPVSNVADENFALYLPNSYKTEDLNSIVFIFEPMGRGKVGIQVFKEAAEAYGHILVCSNTIKNGPYERNFALSERLINHIFTRFNINENRIYFAGFSGGSRLASALATLTNIAAGVVACGAGFSTSHAPTTQRFSYVGICGNRDMNFMEMISATGYLDKLKFKSTLITFDGDHRWPPKEQILRAFTWLSIQEHKKGLIEIQKSVISDYYRSSFIFAERAKNNANTLRAVKDYERILNTYKSFHTLDSIAFKIKTLKKSKLYKNAKKSRIKAFEEEDEQTKKLASRFAKDFNGPKKANMVWWEKQLDKLKNVSKSTDFEWRDMKARLKYKIYALVYEKMIFATPEPNKEQVAFCKEIIKLIYPKSQ